jgi:glucose-1-phosphate cytidylyltransferase
LKVIILCGGQGTRLREETESRPKPLIEIGGRPILWHIMKHFGYHGFRDFVLCLGYRGDMIKRYFLDYEAMNNDLTICLGEQHRIIYHDAHAEQDYTVTLSDTGQNTMTGGRLARVRRHVDGTVFVTYGDGVSDIDLHAALDFHRKHGRLATVTTVRPVHRFGILEVDPSGLVTRFTEKPQAEGWANAGFFVFEPGVFDYLDGDETILEAEPLERLARDGQLMAYRHEGFFFAMDTYREYMHLNNMWEKGQVPWKI